MVGLNKQETLVVLDRLNKTTYEEMYHNKRQELTKKYGKLENDFINDFFLFYIDEILPQIVSDLVEENNNKITEDIKKLLSK